ncbi:MAG TPA: HAD family hydrolase [Sedimentisphaerales bacterium]|nr:HAD family hydrolase [Sedimentisphaerales bacterium]
MVTTVIFDLDDTLYPEREYCMSGFRAVAAYIAERFSQTAAETLFEVMRAQFNAGNRTRTFNAALEAAGIEYDGECIARLVEVYREHHPVLKLPDKSREALDTLRRRYRLALLTDGCMPGQRLKVEALGIKTYFECIVYTEELGRENWKPSPLGFQKIMYELGASAGECAYVGDNEQKDFIAPNALGMASIKVSGPDSLYTTASSDPAARPAHAISSLAELTALLASL